MQGVCEVFVCVLLVSKTLKSRKLVVSCFCATTRLQLFSAKFWANNKCCTVCVILCYCMLVFARILLQLQIWLVHGSCSEEACLMILTFLCLFFM